MGEKMGRCKFIVENKVIAETTSLNEGASQIHNINKSHPDEDCGWAWVVFCGVFVGRTIILGTLLTFTIYVSHFLEVFGASRSFTGFIGSIMWFLYDLSGILNSIIIRNIGPRWSVMLGSVLLTTSLLLSTLATDIYHLMITQGILLGVSANLVNISFVVGLKSYFNKYQNLVQGISISGAGLGVFLMGQIIPNLLHVYGWRGACVIHSGIFLNICVVGALIFPTKLSRTRRTIKSNIQMNFREGWNTLYRTNRFWLLVWSYFFFNFGYVTYVILYKDFVNVRKLTEHFSAALTAFGAGDIVGRLGSGILPSWRRINIVILFAFTHLFCGSVLLLQLTVTQTGLSLILMSFFFGFGSGCANGLFFIVPCCLYGNDVYLIALTFCGAFGGLGSIISAPIAGAIIDSTKSYTGALGMSSSSSYAAAILLIVLFFIRLKRNVYPTFAPVV